MTHGTAIFPTLLLAASQALAAGAALSQDAGVKPHVPLAKTIGQVTPTAPVPSLYVVNSAGATLQGTTLTMTGVSMNSIVFADRPVRAAGHVTTEQFVMQWDKGKSSFADDPPNATISVLGGNGSKVEDAVVTLMSPKLASGNLTFDVAVLEGSLSGTTGPAALFIDRGGFSGFGGGGGDLGGGGHGDFGGGGDFGGRSAGGGRMDDVHVNDVHADYWHAPDYHGAWYAGAGVATGVAVGAAATRPYRYDGYGNPYFNPYYDVYGRCGYYPYPACD